MGSALSDLFASHVPELHCSSSPIDLPFRKIDTNLDDDVQNVYM
jgi:hypothetical protein